MLGTIQEEMSYDSYTQEIHLTPRGWIEGTASYNKEPVSRPSDAVETWRKKVEQSSGYTTEDIQWDLVWESETVGTEELAALHAKFPHPKIADDERIARISKVNSDLRNWKRRRKRVND